MEETLDLDESWSSNEIIAQSPCIKENTHFKEKLSEVQEMLNNLQVNYIKCNERSNK